MDPADIKVKPACCCCCTCCWSIFFIILAALSWKTVSQGEIAMKFSYWTQTVVGDPIVVAGVTYVGPLNGLVRYPSVYQLMYFDDFSNKAGTNEIVKPPIQSRTHDGLKVFVKVSFQWRLEANSLRGIYNILGGAEDLLEGEETSNEKPSFVEALVRFARGSLTTVCSQYTAGEFFGNQSLVEQRMLEELRKTFNQPEKDLLIYVQGLQLRSVNLPDDYENAIAETQKMEQDFETATAERATKEMQMSTIEMQSTQMMLELKKQAMANASAIEQANRAWVEQYMNFQKKQADAYARILQEFKKSPDPYGNLFELMRQKALKEHDPDMLTLSM